MKNAAIYAAWTQDPEVTTFMQIGAFTLEEEQEWIRGALKNPNEKHFEIWIHEDSTLIGTCSLLKIDEVADRGICLGIMIGEKSEWGKGYGVEAIQLLSEKAFEEYNAKRVWLTVHTENERGITCYRKAGLEIVEERPVSSEGCKEGMEYVMDRWIDEI